MDRTGGGGIKLEGLQAPIVLTRCFNSGTPLISPGSAARNSEGVEPALATRAHRSAVEPKGTIVSAPFAPPSTASRRSCRLCVSARDLWQRQEQWYG